MNCAESEQLIDAYLDGELSGSLRLEFDAHRLRCRRCQLTVAMMESVGHVVAGDRSTPLLAEDFTDRVMTAIDRRRPLAVRLRPTRVAIVAGALLQAAAVIYLAVVVQPQPATPPPGVLPTVTRADPDPTERFARADQKVERHEALHDYILSRVEAAWANLTSESQQLARYPLDLGVSGRLARAAPSLEQAGPLGRILEALLPVAAEEAESPTSTDDEHSL